MAAVLERDYASFVLFFGVKSNRVLIAFACGVKEFLEAGVEPLWMHVPIPYFRRMLPISFIQRFRQINPLFKHVASPPIHKLLIRFEEITQRPFLNPRLFTAGTPAQPIIKKLLLDLEFYRGVISFIVFHKDFETLCSRPVFPIVFYILPDEMFFVNHVFKREVQFHLTSAVYPGYRHNDVEDQDAKAGLRCHNFLSVEFA